MLALGLLEARRELSSLDAALDEQLKRREQGAEVLRNRRGSESIADRLRKDLPADAGR